MLGLLVALALTGQSSWAEPAGFPASMPGATQEELQQFKDLQQIKERLADIEAALNDPEGKLAVTAADVKLLKKFVFSGYVQLRYDFMEEAVDKFYARRARLKLTINQSTDLKAVMSFDMGNGVFEAKDIYLLWMPWHAPERGPSLSVGQQNWCFGSEVPTSSSVRDCPERARFAQFLFPKERDLGLKVMTPTGHPLTAEVGVFNGTGINKSDDNDSKDVVGTLRWAFRPNLDVGISGYVGTALVVPAGAPPATVARDMVKNRYGMDFQWVGNGWKVRAEGVVARERGRRPTGWLAQVNRNLGARTVLVGRFDTYDDDGIASNGRVDTWAVGLIRYLDSNLRVKCFWESPREQRARVANDVVRAELIATF